MQIFEAKGDQIHGGEPSDVDAFREEIELIEHSCHAMGQALGMASITHGFVSGGNRTLAFHFQANLDAADEEAAILGLVADEDLPIEETLSLLREEIDRRAAPTIAR